MYVLPHTSYTTLALVPHNNVFRTAPDHFSGLFHIVTSGNHTATQSTFSAPCVPAHDSNDTINGFDSGFRPTNNGTDITILSVPILDSNVNSPFWFYDASAGACGSGAVGVINNNESSTETLAGFVVSESN